MKHYLLGIAGGSGCGKSTLSNKLKEKYSDLIEIVHFDDYQKEKHEIPTFENMTNWDSPEAINFEKLEKDLKILISGKELSIMTKCHKINPNYEKCGRIQHILKPKKIIILEGYMSLVNKKIQNLLDFKIYLNISIENSMKRRNKITYNDESEYNNKILLPMHKKHVEPTKKIADLIIDVERNNANEVFQIVEKKLIEKNLLK